MDSQIFHEASVEVCIKYLHSQRSKLYTDSVNSWSCCEHPFLSAEQILERKVSTHGGSKNLLTAKTFLQQFVLFALN